MSVESIVEQLGFTPGVAGLVVCDRHGIPIRDSFPDLDRSRAIQLAEMAAELVRGAQSVCSISTSPLDSLRIRTRTMEVIVKANEEYILVVLQEVNE